MTARKPRVAVDTCIILNVLLGGDAHSPERLIAAQDVLERAKSGGVDLLVPAIVLPELAANARTRELPYRDREAMNEKVLEWLDQTEYLLVEIDERVARRAAQLAVELELKAGDATVLACAVFAKADCLYTWDKKILRHDSYGGLTVCEPPLPSQLTLEDTERLNDDG